MKILYLSCHAILEYDEVKLFTELGHDVFSMGAYQTSNIGIGVRDPIDNLYENEHLRAVSLQCSKENLHPDLIEWADVVVMMHNSRLDIDDHPQPWLENNWNKFKKAKKPIVWRSIGQSNAQVEESLKRFRKEGLQIVRYSPAEETIPYYQGSDALIRFYKDPAEYGDYAGSVSRVVNVSQALFGGNGVPSRGDHMDLAFFKQVIEGFDWKIFGPHNDDAGGHNGGLLSFPDLKQMLRFNRVYFYTGTRPASYTLAFIEAMMTGIPIVSIGPERGNAIYTDQKTFEVADIIGTNGVGGFWSDNLSEIRKHLQALLDDHSLALHVGQTGRQRAINLFGKQTIAEQWKNFFDIIK